MSQTTDREWWKDFFDAFRPIFGIVSPKNTGMQVRFIMKELGLKTGSKFLDCPCGIGRISIPLAKKGIQVTAVDSTQSYLDELVAVTRKRHLPITIHRFDMRRIPFRSEFDAAANLWTSFGFFEKESDNLAVLKKTHRALKPGGKFVLHVINRDWIMANFQKSDWFEANNVKVLQSNAFDFTTSTSIGTWTFIRNCQERTLESRIRMYSYHELIELFDKAGFKDIRGYGSVTKTPVALDSRMMWVFGTKPRK